MSKSHGGSCVTDGVSAHCAPPRDAGAAAREVGP